MVSLAVCCITELALPSIRFLRLPAGSFLSLFTASASSVWYVFARFHLHTVQNVPETAPCHELLVHGQT